MSEELVSSAGLEMARVAWRESRTTLVRPATEGVLAVGAWMSRRQRGHGLV